METFQEVHDEKLQVFRNEANNKIEGAKAAYATGAGKAVTEERGDDKKSDSSRETEI